MKTGTLHQHILSSFNPSNCNKKESGKIPEELCGVLLRLPFFFFCRQHRVMRFSVSSFLFR